MRPPSTGLFVLPVYGAASPFDCGHRPTVESVPPRPPSATYRSPDGPNVRPRGLLKPVANTEMLAWVLACVDVDAWPLPTRPAATAVTAMATRIRLIPSPFGADCSSVGDSPHLRTRGQGACRRADTGRRVFLGLPEVLVHEGDGHAPFPHRGCDTLHRTEPHVAAREHAGHARLEQVRIAIELPPSRIANVGAGEDVAATIECDLRRQPRRLRVGADEDEN